MSSARRTPRYTAAIGELPVGPQRMGPHPAGVLPRERGLASTARPIAPGGRADIIPLRPLDPRHAAALPRDTTALLPRRAGRRLSVPVDRRPWRVLIVSASPGAAPRSFDVPRWQARVAIGLVTLLAVMAIGFVAVVAVAVQSPGLLMEGGDAVALRSSLAATQDSLALLRASVDGVASASGDEGADLADEAAPALAPAPAAAAAATAPVHHERAARVPRTADQPMARPLAAMPRTLSELPVIGALVSGFSLARRHPLLHVTRPHLGIDLAAPRGTRVSAPAPGLVRFVGHKFGFGLVVELDHGDGIVTRYAHLRSAAVEPGERVTRGEAIAAVGTSGITTGPHLHYEVLVHGRQVDPLRYHFDAAVAAGEPAAAASAVRIVAPVAAPPAAQGSAAVHEAAPSDPLPAPR